MADEDAADQRVDGPGLSQHVAGGDTGGHDGRGGQRLAVVRAPADGKISGFGGPVATRSFSSSAPVRRTERRCRRYVDRSFNVVSLSPPDRQQRLPVALLAE